jgi:hypothetical protein
MAIAKVSELDKIVGDVFGNWCPSISLTEASLGTGTDSRVQKRGVFSCNFFEPLGDVVKMIVLNKDTPAGHDS